MTQLPYTTRHLTIRRQNCPATIGGFYIVEPPEGPAEAYVAYRDSAVLFTAAPQLLAACQAALARIESDIESDEMKTSEGDLCRAAIAAATALRGTGTDRRPGVDGRRLPGRCGGSKEG